MKLNTNIAFGILIICITSCGYMNKVSIYEPSTSISAFDKFPQKYFLLALMKMGFGA